MGVVVFVGTAKGAFTLRSEDRRSWDISGPLFPGWKITTSDRSADGTFFVGTSSYVYGAAIHRSDNMVDFQQIEAGPKYSDGGDRTLNQIWKLDCSSSTFYAGVDEAGLFRSTDGGSQWKPVDGLNDHPTRAKWFPGNGGLCAHSLLVEPARERLHCGISAVGVFRSDDAGETWQTRNDGVRVIIEDQDHKDIGFCVHALAQDPDAPDHIWRQEHTGMFRSRDGGDTWQAIEDGLPSTFGFPIVRDHSSRNLYSFPLDKDEYRMPADGHFAVYRSTDDGDSWEPRGSGLPQRFYAGVLRGAMDTDHDGGVYVGSTAGTVHTSHDHGESWQTVEAILPRILTVDVYQD